MPRRRSLDHLSLLPRPKQSWRGTRMDCESSKPACGRSTRSARISYGSRIPEPGRFEGRESYYATLFHELVHSTHHCSRLNRGLDKAPAPFGSPDYSKEELVAEMGAAFLAAVAGISPLTIEQSAAYFDGWRKRLNGDKKLVVHAAGAAQRAADWVTDKRPEPV